jgi:hypothetical protein
MDFMKAFDKVPHTRLLVKMKAYGFHVSLHLNNSLRSDCMILASLSSFISLKNFVSSAKRNISDFTHSGRSFRPHLEYASSVWSPYKKKDIEAIENVQKRATRMLSQMKNLNYEERLKLLKMTTLFQVWTD